MPESTLAEFDPPNGISGGFTTWEYPYFRDAADNWRPRLLQLRSLGARIISTYIPWRHHETMFEHGVATYDFTGNTQPNRDVRGFIATCAELGLKLVLKPGPFCHAELNYGGLPDRVRPGVDFAAQLRADGTPTTWVGAQADADGAPQQWALPSLADPRMLAAVDQWLADVRDHVLAPAVAPRGPLVGLQVGNEGIYSDAQHAMWAHDYSEPALAEYRQWLQERHGDVSDCGRAYGQEYRGWADVMPPGPQDALPALTLAARWTDFSLWQAEVLGRRYARWYKILDLGLPTFANVNPPVGDSWGVDTWLARVDPVRWGGVRYGYTNWIGLAAREASALARYNLLTRITPGPNFEENWGFSEQYDIRYQYPNVCFQQTLVAIAGGAKGVNFYTAVSTDAWDEDLDRFENRPYPAHSPVRADGSEWAMTAVARDLAAYLHQHGLELAQSVPISGVAWGADRFAARWAAWQAPVVADTDHGLTPGERYLAAHAELTACGLDLDVVDLADPLPDGPGSPVIVLAGVPVMERAVHARLLAYCVEGGSVVIIGNPATIDETGQPLPPWGEGLTVVGSAAELPRALAGRAEPRPVTRTGDALVWVRRHPVTEVVHVIVVTRECGQISIEVPQGQGTVSLTVSVAPDAGALVRIDRGQVTAALLKGAAEQTGAEVRPAVVCGDQRILAEGPGDLLSGVVYLS